MEDLSIKFSNCIFDTEKIRNIIKTILKVDDSHYFCYKCFCLIGSFNKGIYCKKCYQFYCKKCAGTMYKDGTLYIDTSKCIQCVENDKNPPLLLYEL
jgi:hypothetical protein